MSQANLEIIGGKAVRRMFDIAAQKIGPQLNKEMNASALTIEKTAKELAPANFGKLRQSIKHNIGEPLMKTVYSELRYAPYVEFGTGRKVFQIKGGGQVNPKYHKFAAQFKGKGKGDYYDFLMAILQWVERKKLAQITNSYTGRKSTKKEDVIWLAEQIAFRILKNGVQAQPFLIPAYEMEKPKLIKRIQNLLKK
jgi:hypothetical protein